MYDTHIVINANATEYLFVSSHQNAKQNHTMKTENKSFENTAKFIYVKRKQL